jgi:hypothetical protein
MKYLNVSRWEMKYANTNSHFEEIIDALAVSASK